MIFNTTYQFKGSHAEKVRRLCSPFSEQNKLFDRYLDVYILAPIVGFLYNRISPLQSSSDTATIMYDQISSELNTLWFNYRLIMLLDKDYELDSNKRMDKAFRNNGKEVAELDEKQYEAYVRGGVEVLYEKLIEPSNTAEDYLKNLYDFMAEFEERYGQNSDDIIDLCRLARN